MGRSIRPMRKAKIAGSDPTAAPRLIVPMSLQLAIPRRVALQQSSPPLHQFGATLKKKAQFEKQKPWNGKCASSKLSQLRGSPQKPVLLKASYGIRLYFGSKRERHHYRYCRKLRSLLVPCPENIRARSCR